MIGSLATLRHATVAIGAALFLSGCETTPKSAPGPANAGYTTRSPEAYRLQTASAAALQKLFDNYPDARRLSQTAVAVLSFPNVTRGGFMFGGQTGNGTLFFRDGSIGGYYNTTAASYGLQAGIQQFGYALFFMDDNAIRRLNKSGGWEIGSSPSLVVVDSGMASSMSTTTLTKGVYAFIFDQKGLMAGLGLFGFKVSRIDP